MKRMENQKIIDIINMCSNKFFMPVMSISFLCFNTVINLWITNRIETIQNILAILLLITVVINILCLRPLQILYTIKNNVFLVCYFIVRIISLLNSGVDYGVLRTILFECFFLIGICHFTTQKINMKKFYIRFYMCFEFISTLLCITLFIAVPYLTKAMQTIVEKYTYYSDFNKTALFSNVNTVGILSGFALVLAIVIYNQNIVCKKIVVIFGLYNIVVMIYCETRSAYIGVIIVAFFMALKLIISSLTAKKITIIAMCFMILTIVPIYILIGFHENKETLSYTEIEDKINSASTFRYAIWKECFITQKDSLLFGKGNLKLEQESRRDLMKNFDESEVDYRYFIAAEVGPHNGYIGMISGVGWLGFVLFIVVVIIKINKSRNLKYNNWYLLLIFIFAINCFECLFILNRFFTCFYMFLILEADWNTEDKNCKTDLRRFKLYINN